MKKDICWGYLGGIIDGEGAVTSPRLRPSGAIIITNTDRELLQTIKIFLNKNQIKASIYQRKTKQKSYHKYGYILRIHGWKNIKIIFKNCPILSEEKRLRLKSIIQYGENKEALKQKRINNFIELKRKHPEYSLRKIAKVLNENLSHILYRWKVKEILQNIENCTQN